MYSRYIDKLMMSGRVSFTFDEALRELGVNESSAKAGLYRLKRDGKLISPAKGLYVVIPPEHRSYGTIPAKQLVPLVMEYLSAEYYVGLLSAASFYGAEHQKVFNFQVVTNKRIVHPMLFGETKIEIIKKKVLVDLPIKKFVVDTGYIHVASPELTAIDMLEYPHRSGGINHIATVLSELVESIDVNKLIMLAEKLNVLYQIQRIGYIFERIDFMDDAKKIKMLDSILHFLEGRKTKYIFLDSGVYVPGSSRCKKWKIIENAAVESDL